MNQVQKEKFLIYYKGISDPEQRVETLIGILKSERKGSRSFRLVDLLPEGIVISKQAIKDALKGKGTKLRRPGSASDLVRQKAAEALGFKAEELWPKLYK